MSWPKTRDYLGMMSPPVSMSPDFSLLCRLRTPSAPARSLPPRPPPSPAWLRRLKQRQTMNMLNLRQIDQQPTR